MKVILKQDVKGLGKAESLVNASDGYARNYLLPRGMAVEATPAHLNEMKAKKDAVDKMKTTIIALFILCCSLNSQDLPYRWHSFFQPNNINTIIYSDGIFNYDKFTFPNGGDAGFVWPASANQRLTAVFSTGLYLLGKVNGSYRSAGALYSSQFSGGNIPVIGQVPPASVCTD